MQRQCRSSPGVGNEVSWDGRTAISCWWSPSGPSTFVFLFPLSAIARHKKELAAWHRVFIDTSWCSGVQKIHSSFDLRDFEQNVKIHWFVSARRNVSHAKTFHAVSSVLQVYSHERVHDCGVPHAGSLSLGRIRSCDLSQSPVHILAYVLIQRLWSFHYDAKLKTWMCLPFKNVEEANQWHTRS